MIIYNFAKEVNAKEVNAKALTHIHILRMSYLIIT